MKNRFIIILLLLISMSACKYQIHKSKSVNNKKPNVIIIFTDDQGYQDVGCFGFSGY